MIDQNLNIHRNKNTEILVQYEHIPKKNRRKNYQNRKPNLKLELHNYIIPSIAGQLPDGVGVPATTYDYLRPSQFAYTSLIL